MFIIKIVEFFFMLFVGYLCFILLRMFFFPVRGTRKNGRRSGTARDEKKRDNTIELGKDEYKVE